MQKSTTLQLVAPTAGLPSGEIAQFVWQRVHGSFVLCHGNQQKTPSEADNWLVVSTPLKNMKVSWDD